jgi:hypothetical protein
MSGRLSGRTAKTGRVRPGRRGCRRGGPPLLAGLALLLTALAGLLAPAADAASIVPHKAVYALRLAEEQAEFGGVSDARGKLEFDWEDVCDGWAVRQRTHIIVTHRDGSEIAFGWSLNAWEAKDGLSYRFFVKRLFATGESEEIQGSARLERPGGPGEALYERPEERRLALPAGTIFPTQHSREVIEAVESDALPFWRVVFDGSGEEGLFGINVALARELGPDAPHSLASPMLREVPSWHVGVAYFGMTEDSQAEPEYEQEMRLYANGVVDDLLLDYGDFTLDATLADLQEAPAPGC